MRLDWKSILGIVITVSLLWWLFRNEDPVEIWNSVRGADLWLLTLSVAITTAGFAVRAMRWKLFLKPVQADSPFRSRFAAVCIHFMANNLLPARVGEFARAFAYSRMEPVPATTAFATMVVERFMDGLAVLILLFVAMLSPSFPAETLPETVTAGIQSVSVLLGVVLLGSIVLVALPDRSVSLFAWVVRRLMPTKVSDRLVTAMSGFVGGLGSLRDPWLLAWAMVWSLGFWAFHSLSFWVGLWAFGIDLPFAAALFMNATIAFMVAVPAAPGFVGTLQLGVKLALVDVYGVATAPALGFAVGWHLGSFVPVTVIGLWFARKLGLSLGEMSADADPTDSPPSTESLR